MPDMYPQTVLVAIIICAPDRRTKGIVGALVGLFSAFMPPLASYFVPFGYYIPLSAYEVANWDMATHTVTYGTRPFNWGLLAFTLALGAVLFALAWRKVQDEEV